MDIWLLSAILLVLALVPCGIIISFAPVMDRLVGLELASIICVLTLMLLSQAFLQPSFFDIALTLAFLSVPAGLMFSFFLERWL